MAERLQSTYHWLSFHKKTVSHKELRIYKRNKRRGQRPPMISPEQTLGRIKTLGRKGAGDGALKREKNKALGTRYGELFYDEN